MIFKASNMENAIKKAEELFNCERDQLNINEINPPTEKFMGLIKVQGEYEIDIIPTIVEQEAEVEAEAEFEEDLDNKNGTVKIISGEVIVKNPIGNGKNSYIRNNDPNIDIYINDEKVSGLYYLSESDEVKIKPHSNESSSIIDVIISEDKLIAEIEIEKINGKNFFVPDYEESNFIEIIAQYKEIPCKEITLEQCIKELEKKSVYSKLIDINEINELIKLPSGGKSVVAKGIKQIDGAPSKIKYLFQNEYYHNPDFGTSKKVSLLDHTIIPSVSIDEVLAVKLSQPMEGRDGITVTGELIKAKEGKEIILKVGKGAELIEDGKKIIAISAGRPLLKNGTVSVIPLLIIPKDVSPNTGNINYDGDVLVRGSVLDNMSVTAGCNITVAGNVYHANLIAKGDIQVNGNVINGNIEAGANVASLMCVLPKLEKVAIIVKKIFFDINDSNEGLTYKNDEKYKCLELVKGIEEVYSILKNEEREILTLLLNKLLRLINFNLQKDVNADQKKDVYGELCNFIDSVKNTLNKSANIKLKYSQKSLIQANGNIIFSGKGSYHTDLIARDTIVFKTAASSVIGGKLIAGKSIKMGTVGSPAGVSTYCKVIKSTGTIDAAYFFSNTIIDINDYVTVVNSDSDKYVN